MADLISYFREGEDVPSVVNPDHLLNVIKAAAIAEQRGVLSSELAAQMPYMALREGTLKGSPEGELYLGLTAGTGMWVGGSGASVGGRIANTMFPKEAKMALINKGGSGTFQPQNISNKNGSLSDAMAMATLLAYNSRNSGGDVAKAVQSYNGKGDSKYAGNVDAIRQAIDSNPQNAAMKKFIADTVSMFRKQK